jgi:hypothetical protein
MRSNVQTPNSPLRALLSMTEPQEVMALARMHNLVTLPDHYTIDRLNDSLPQWLDAVLHHPNSLPPARFYQT